MVGPRTKNQKSAPSLTAPHSRNRADALDSVMTIITFYLLYTSDETIDKNDDGVPVALNINESFLGFGEVESQKGADLTKPSLQK